ncbi:MAG: peptide chain release factor N(5)-glutamine methyltransferase [Nitrospinae bacterium]|nr:peptide chain release factor N(5)-glutamine methyltransferase [Nitrospinota bacterium]
MSLTYGEAMGRAREILDRAGSPSAALDAQLLLAHAAGLDRAGALARLRDCAAGGTIHIFEDLIRRRAAREPVAYLTGEKEFYSLAFAVDRRALIPRPETETLVEAALSLLPADHSARVAELGAGSGAVAVALAVNRPGWSLDAGDISADALVLARHNAARHGVSGRVTFHHSSLFARMPDGPYHAVVSNPPYVPGGAPVDPEAALYEPSLALYAGDDGLEVIRRIVADTPARLSSGGWLLMEMGDGQAGAVLGLFDGGPWAETRLFNDLAGTARVVAARRA